MKPLEMYRFNNYDGYVYISNYIYLIKYYNYTYTHNIHKINYVVSAYFSPNMHAHRFILRNCDNIRDCIVKNYEKMIITFIFKNTNLLSRVYYYLAVHSQCTYKLTNKHYSQK